MTFAVLLTPRAGKSLRKLGRSVGPHVLDALKDLETTPEGGDRLTPSRFWKVRVGEYRVIYEIDRPASRVIVLFIGHRKNVYDEFARML